MYKPPKTEKYIDRKLRPYIDDGYTKYKSDQKYLRQAKRDEFWRKVILRLMFRHIKVDPKKILFLSFSGNYDCNPKYIAEELINQNVDAHLVWGVYPKTRTKKPYFPEQVQKELRSTYNFYKEMASAKIIIDNGVSAAHLYFKKKRNQVLIETWHGSLGIKKFGPGANNDYFWFYKATKESAMTNYIISNSDFEDSVYRETFWKKTPIWKFGHPRNDILFCKDQSKIDSFKSFIYEKYKIPEGKKLCLYGPTFRDDGDLSPYKLDYDRLCEALSKRFGGEWIILTRFHNATKKKLKDYVFPKNVINVSGYPDIQELMVLVDCGITDYSSWICEYMLTRKPGFTFALDVDEYANHERQLYFQLDELPFPTSSSMDELVHQIEVFDNDKYVSDCNAFIKARGSVDDGLAAARTVAEIKKILNKKKAK